MPAHVLVRRLIQRAAFALACSGPMLVVAQETSAPQPAPPELELTLPQAQQVMQHALGTGQSDLARTLAYGLLQADARSGIAHYSLAVAEGQLDRPKQAQRAAAKAYRFAQGPLQHFEAAQLAARMSYKARRPTRTQLWLRRAMQHAPNERIEAQLERDYRRVRAQNPLSFSIRGGLRPSSNVNNGADSGLQIIDGLPYVGTLSGNAQALSGVIAHADGRIAYRLGGSKSSRTEIAARLYVKRVALDGDAKTLAPDSRNRDFGSTYGTIGLSHAFAWGARKDVSRIGLQLGQYHIGGKRSYDFARLDAAQHWRLDRGASVTLNAGVELRESAFGNRFDTQVLSLGLGSRHHLRNGDAVTFALNLQKADGDLANARSRGVALSAGYSLNKQIGPAMLSGGVTLAHVDYPKYTAFFAVPGGRQDLSASAHLDMLFPDLDYAGFAPNLRVTTSRTTSNVSRFKTKELSVALGIQSKF